MARPPTGRMRDRFQSLFIPCGAKNRPLDPIELSLQVLVNRIITSKILESKRESQIYVFNGLNPRFAAGSFMRFSGKHFEKLATTKSKNSQNPQEFGSFFEKADSLQYVNKYALKYKYRNPSTKLSLKVVIQWYAKIPISNARQIAESPKLIRRLNDSILFSLFLLALFIKIKSLHH